MTPHEVFPVCVLSFWASPSAVQALLLALCSGTWPSSEGHLWCWVLTGVSSLQGEPTLTSLLSLCPRPPVLQFSLKLQLIADSLGLSSLHFDAHLCSSLLRRLGCVSFLPRWWRANPGQLLPFFGGGDTIPCILTHVTPVPASCPHLQGRTWDWRGEVTCMR